MSAEDKAIRFAKKQWDLFLFGTCFHAALLSLAVDKPAMWTVALFIASVFWGIFALVRREK